jgi:DNA-binding transcriptional ArsR family regulator
MSGGSAVAATVDPVATFAALGDPVRLALISRLSDGETRSIAVLAGDTRLTRQAVTKHLHVLERAGLVRSLRVGRETRFAYLPEPIARARSYLDAVSEHWDGALSRLRAHVET